MGSYPTLAEIKASYGNGSDSYWLIPQLTNICLFCGCKDKLSTVQYKEMAQLIATDYYFLKVSEIMLFFKQFKLGKFGKFYGAVDPMVIMIALKDFCDERASLLEHWEKGRYWQRMEAECKNSISYEEYQRRKENGEYPTLAKIAGNASESPKKD